MIRVYDFRDSVDELTFVRNEMRRRVWLAQNDGTVAAHWLATTFWDSGPREGRSFGSFEKSNFANEKQKLASIYCPHKKEIEW